MIGAILLAYHKKIGKEGINIIEMVKGQRTDYWIKYRTYISKYLGGILIVAGIVYVIKYFI